MRFFYVTIVFLAAALLLLRTETAHASILSVNPDHDSVAAGETVVVDIRLDSELENINAVELSLSYPRSLLAVEDISRGGSFLTLWPEEPNDDSSLGTITMTGGVPNGSVVMNGLVARMTFRAITTGTATLTFLPEASRVLLNDGSGTESSLSFSASALTIVPASDSILSITSRTHPDEDTWYRATTAEFTWTPRPDALYSYLLSEDAGAVPDQQPEEAPGSATIADVADGIYYFILAERLPGDEWTVVGKRRIRIDATPPADLVAYWTDDVVLGKTVLVFSAHDRMSGGVAFAVLAGDPALADLGSFTVISPYEGDPTQEYALFAMDAAGNVQRISLPAVQRAGGSNMKLFGIAVWILILIVLLIVFRGRLQTKRPDRRSRST